MILNCGLPSLYTFFVLFGNFIWKKLSSFLDNKINDISNEINDANNIHNEAKILLSSETKISRFRK